MKHKLFVYGTLMQGMYNHVLLKDSKFICKASTPGMLYAYEGLPFLVYTPLASSMLRSTEGTSEYMSLSLVQGELYEIDDETLGYVDSLEGYSEDAEPIDSRWYRRISVNGGVHGQVWVYVVVEPFESAVRIDDGCWRKYNNEWYERQRANG